MVDSLPPSTMARIRHDADRLQLRALAEPLDAGKVPTIQGQWTYYRVTRSVLASMSVESCGCLSETPLWHVSVSAWSLITRQKRDDETLTRTVAEALLHGVGSVDSLWWWNPERRVGHLRTHLTPAEAHVTAPHIAGPEDHQEDGEWYHRKVDG